MDAGRHGFRDLCPGPQPRVDGIASQVRHQSHLRQCGMGGINSVCSVSFWMGTLAGVGPIADRFGRSRVLASTIFVYAIFTGFAALSQNVWQLGLFRLLAGIGIGGEWALGGTYIAEAWPEDRRKMGAGYLQTGYYAGFFLASALNFTVGATFGWRTMFLCGVAPILVAIAILLWVKEPERWAHRHHRERAASANEHNPFAVIF